MFVTAGVLSMVDQEGERRAEVCLHGGSIWRVEEPQSTVLTAVKTNDGAVTEPTGNVVCCFLGAVASLMESDKTK